MRPRTFLALLCWTAGSALSCSLPPPPVDPAAAGSSSARLKPLSAPIPAEFVHRRIYVSVYSSVHLGLDADHLMVNLAATVSVRNVSLEQPLILTHARYYDSAGQPVRDYVQAPAQLPPMASVEYVIKRSDLSGGPGANFVIEWAGPAEMDAPIVEAVMIGQSGHAGFSFTSVGKAVQRTQR